jgi:predicted membrane protein
MNKHIVRTLWGIGLIAFGVTALLGSLDIIDFKNFINDWWPLLIIVGGLLMFISNPRQYIWPLFVVLWGILLQLRELDVFNFNVWEVLWPILIITVGLSIIFNRAQSHKGASKNELDDLSAIFGGNTTKNHSSDYKGGDITAMFGGVELDLRKATITKEAAINVFALCGGITITVPENWTVKSQINPIMGGVENKTTPPIESNGPVLIISGDVIMSGVEIKH